MNELPILAVDDDVVVLENLFLQQEIPIVAFSQPSEAKRYLSGNAVGLLLIDLKRAGQADIDSERAKFIEDFHCANAGTPIIVMGGWKVPSNLHPANDASAGYAAAGYSHPDLLTLVQNLRHRHSTGPNRSTTNFSAATAAGQRFKGEPIVAVSGVMRDIMVRIDQVAQSDANILLTGENGTGKTQMASLLHDRSRRANNRFVAVNMGAIPESLFESELFGHVRGAFTDAKLDRIGRVELADKGTLFLDEITNTTLGQQAKLLRLLDQKQFEKVGASKTQEADLRIIAATNADVQGLVREGQFRLDLLFRLNTIEIKLPPLRQRLEDIPLLTEHFLEKFSQKYGKTGLSLSQSAMEAVQTYSWPGNVRELSHVMERAVILATRSTIPVLDLMLPNSPPSSAPRPSSVSLNEIIANDSHHPTLDELEETIVLRRLAEFENDVIRTAFSLGISRSALYRRLQKNRERSAC